MAEGWRLGGTERGVAETFILSVSHTSVGGCLAHLLFSQGERIDSFSFQSLKNKGASKVKSFKGKDLKVNINVMKNKPLRILQSISFISLMFHYKVLFKGISSIKY